MQIENRSLKSKRLELDYLELSLGGKALRYAATGLSSVKRARSLLTKEPVTIAWIDGFDEGATLFDIGANVGTYTIYAAVMRGAKVVSFEPEALNYAELNKNIFLNDLHGRVLGYCIALTDENRIDRLLLSDFVIGSSFHDFGENTWTEDKLFGQDWFCAKDGRREQGCVGRSLDSLIGEGLATPQHVKIDVDGLEHRVIAGMSATLDDPGLRSVLVEISFDSAAWVGVIESMTARGWRFSWNQLRCDRRRPTIADIERMQADGEGSLNYIFYRDAAYDAFFDRTFEAFSAAAAA